MPAAKILGTLAIAVVLLSACGNPDSIKPRAKSTDGPERLSVRASISSIWSDLEAVKKERACRGYIASEVLTSDGQRDAEGLGFVLSQGSLTSFDEDLVNEEWRRLLDVACANTEVETYELPNTPCRLSATKGISVGECVLNTETKQVLTRICLDSSAKRIQVRREGSNLTVISASPQELPSYDCPAGQTAWQFEVPLYTIRTMGDLGNGIAITGGKNEKKVLTVLSYEVGQ